MIRDFLITYHPWNILREATSLPTELQIEIMKGIMDGKPIDYIAKENSIKVKDAKDILESGMETINARNLYELIFWGLKNRVIKDKPIDISDFISKHRYEGHPQWLTVLEMTISGYTEAEIQKEARLNKSQLEFFRNFIAKHFNLGPSLAEYIRFGLSALNPVEPISRFTRYSDNPRPYQTIKHPPVKSKYRPADIDPDIPVYDTKKMIARDVEDDDKKAIKKLVKRIKVEPQKHHVVRVTAIQTALELLGIDRKLINKKGYGLKFWDRPSSDLWNLLELAKRRYHLEMAHAHPDKGGDPKRAAQLGSAWSHVRRLFQKHGYDLHE